MEASIEVGVTLNPDCSMVGGWLRATSEYRSRLHNTKRLSQDVEAALGNAFLAGCLGVFKKRFEN
jgi:hypothetical protein